MPVPLLWFFYTGLCIWVHTLFPGLDCFAPALIVCLHRKQYRTTFWLGLAWLLVNEGVGSLAFGSSILWYSGLILFFFLIQLFLSSGHVYFVLALALFAGCWQFFLFSSMARLQEVIVPQERLLAGSVLTALFFPLGWMLIQRLARQNRGGYRV